MGQRPVSEAYLGLEGNELQNHLHREEAGEQHVENVHGDFEQAALPVVLQGRGPCMSRGSLLPATPQHSAWGADHPRGAPQVPPVSAGTASAAAQRLVLLP